MHEWGETQIMTVLTEQGLLNNKFEHKRNYVLICCPFHNDSNPSMGIDFNKGVAHCFAGCFDGTFTQFIYKLLGVTGATVEYIKRFQGEDFYKFERLPRKQHKPKITTPSWDDLEISEEELAKYDFTDWAYSKARGISEEICREFRLGIDYEWGAVTFPLKIEGKYRAICRREIANKRFHIPPELRGRKPLAYLGEALSISKRVVLVEGVYDALTCYTYGVPAIATLGMPTEQQALTLRSYPDIELLIACDGDDAGTKFAKKVSEWLKDKCKANTISLPKGMDINDLVTKDRTGGLFNKIIKGRWEGK